MNLYSVDVKLAATVYVKANSHEEALKKAKEWIPADTTLEINGGEFCENAFHDPVLPAISLSPAMTSHGVWGEADLVEENVPPPRAE